MCIAIWYPAEAKDIDRETLLRCAETNKDGFGLMYSEDNKLRIEKGFFSPGLFANRIQILRKQGKSLVLHWRYATHGAVNLDGCHPHIIDDNLAFVHNGVINCGHKKEDPRSDTMIFRDAVLVNMPPKWLDYMGARILIDNAIGYSKLVFMDNEGRVDIIGENLGHWEGGSWFSNKGHQKSIVNYKAAGAWERCAWCNTFQADLDDGMCKKCLENTEPEKKQEDFTEADWDALALEEEIKEYIADKAEFGHDMDFIEWRNMQKALTDSETELSSMENPRCSL